MKKPVLAVDIDEVLTPTTQLIVSALGAKYGVSIPATHTPLGGLREEIVRLATVPFLTVSQDMQAYLMSSDFGRAKPIKGSVEALRELSRTYEIVAITVRPMELRPRTTGWIAQNFAGIIAQTYFPNETTVSHGGKYKFTDKTHDLVEMGARWLVDDNVAHLEPLDGTGIRGILFGNYPWNSEAVVPPNAQRAQGWDDCLAVIARTSNT